MIALRADRARLFRGDFGVRIGHGEYDRLVRHGAHHVLGHRALHRQSEHHIGAFQSLEQRARLGIGGVRRLPLVHAVGATLVDHALGVAQNDMFRPHAHRLEQFDAGDACRPGAVDHKLGVAQLAAGQVAGVDQPRGGDDGGAVLVIVEHRDIHQLPQPLLYDETFRRLDVFQVDAAEAGQEADGIDDLVHVLRVDLQVDAVDVGKALEQRHLALHHRLRGDRTEIAETEHCGTVGDHRDHVALGRVIVGERRIAGDVQARLGDAGRIGKRQIARRGDRLGDAGFQLAGTAR